MDGRGFVLITGGLNSIEGGCFCSPLATARSFPTAMLLNNGKVLIVGGYANWGLTSAELYDPATGTFSLTGESSNRDAFPATTSLLPNGNVVATPDYCCDFDDQAEVYDSSTGTFTATGNTTAARIDGTARPLPHGKVLIAGKDDTGFPLYEGSGDLYDPVTGKFSPARSMLPIRAGRFAAVTFATRWLLSNTTLLIDSVHRK
ncbi:MAG TPA: hypothetical protein VGN17_03140 [Bryobacteraceae bacterium]|jgi:hypothetical protein